jgi:hypothetical protein
MVMRRAAIAAPIMSPRTVFIYVVSRVNRAAGARMWFVADSPSESMVLRTSVRDLAGSPYGRFCRALETAATRTRPTAPTSTTPSSSVWQDNRTDERSACSCRSVTRSTRKAAAGRTPGRPSRRGHPGDQLHRRLRRLPVPHARGARAGSVPDAHGLDPNIYGQSITVPAD